MNNKFKLPKIDILFQFITAIRLMVFPLVLLFINVIKLLPWWGTCAIIAGVLLLIFIFVYLGWRNFQYLFMEDRIIIYSGIFTKKEKTIYYQRIHSVNISQNIIHRLLNFANLSIETPGVAMGKSDGEIRCLSIDKAKYLQSLLQRMGEASRSDVAERKEQLLQSIVVNMENSTSRNIVEMNANDQQADADQAATTNSNAADDDHKQQPAALSVESTSEPEVKVTLDSLLMFKSAITSLNLNIVLVWFAGIFTFADDIINLLFPESTFIEDFFDQFEVNKSVFIVIAVTLISAIVATWVLSLIFYIIKFFDYKLERKGKQIHVSYGLLNRQGIVFNDNKVQSIIFEENPIRQWIGYGELKVNIVKAVQENSQNFSTDIVIHPFIRKEEVASYIKELMPKRELNSHEATERIPSASLRTYLFIPLLFSFIPTVASAYWLKWSALWFLFLPVIVAAWRYIQFKTVRFSIDGAEIKLVKRDFAKQTIYVKRQSLIILAEHASPYQRKKGLRRLSFNTLGGLISTKYVLQGISEEQMNRAKQWLSQYLKK